MPLINHVRGDVIPNALLNVRTPMIRLPLWVTITWSILRALGRLAVVYLRFWPVTLPASLLLGLYLRLGWAGPVTAILAPTLLLTLWWWRWRTSYRRFAWLPALSRYREGHSKVDRRDHMSPWVRIAGTAVAPTTCRASDVETAAGYL